MALLATDMRTGAVGQGDGRPAGGSSVIDKLAQAGARSENGKLLERPR
jgi:hypothetical protein